MEKQLTITIPYVPGEEGLTIACREGNLFRNDAKLEDLYKDGFRITNYSIEKDPGGKSLPNRGTKVKVFLTK